LVFRELTPEREEELIEQVAKMIVKYGLSNIFMNVTKYTYNYYPTFLGQMGAYHLFPYSFLLGDAGPDLLKLITKDPKNMNRIVERVNELETLTLMEEEEAARNRPEKPRRSFFSSLLGRLKSLF
jgi:hypothetical protein